MKKIIIYLYSILLIVASICPWPLEARLSNQAEQGMLGVSAHTKILQKNSGDVCKNLQQLLQQQPVIDTYVSARYQNYKGVTFASGCNLTYPGALPGYADLSYAVFSYASMVQIHLESAMLNGVDARFADLTGAHLDGINAAAMPINISQAILNKASIRHAYLQGANLSGVQAEKVRFTSTSLQNAILNKGIFLQADFRSARLLDVQARNAVFRKADFTGAVVSGDISGADFTGAVGMMHAAFTQLFYTQGNPPKGLPEKIMSSVQVVARSSQHSQGSMLHRSGFVGGVV